MQAGLGSLQAPIRVSVSAFCLYGNNPLAQVLCMFASSCGLVGTWAAPPPLDAEIWGGAVGGSWLGCLVTSTLRRKTGGQVSTTSKTLWSPWEPSGQGGLLYCQLLDGGSQVKLPGFSPAVAFSQLCDGGDIASPFRASISFPMRGR